MEKIDCQIRNLGDVTGKTLIIIPSATLSAKDSGEKFMEQWQKALPDSKVIIVKKGFVESITVMEGIPETVVVNYPALSDGASGFTEDASCRPSPPA